jgi:hypothetical protein
MTNVGFTKLGLYQQRIHILDSRQPTLEFMHNKMGMYPLAAGNLQWQWTFTSFNKQFVPMSKNQQLARTSFFPRHANGKVSKSWGKHISKRIQTDAKGSKRSIAGGNKHIVWDPPICLDAKPKGDLMVSLFTLMVDSKSLTTKWLKFFLLTMPNHLWVHWDWYPGTPITLLKDAPIWAMSTGPTFEWLSATIMYRLVDATVTPLLEAMRIKGHQTRC